VTCRILQGDCREVLDTIPDSSVHCAVTSPPYFGLRDYGHDGQIGLEPTPDEFVNQMVLVFREVRRVLRDDGTLWLNLGDSYNSGPSGGLDGSTLDGGRDSQKERRKAQFHRAPGLKHKDLIGIPWRVAFALQADGWYLRQDIIWHKPNSMPESVTDRCTKAHEYIFLLSKSERYFFDASAIAEPVAASSIPRLKQDIAQQHGSDRVPGKTNGTMKAVGGHGGKRNRRSVWTVTTKPFKGAHFATFPPDLIQPCILAGCPRGGIVLDLFGGAGTTGLVAERLGLDSILIELNEGYCQMARDRIRADRGKVECSVPEAGRDSGPLFEDAAE
jgi:DNA modification methylase